MVGVWVGAAGGWAAVGGDAVGGLGEGEGWLVGGWFLLGVWGLFFFVLSVCLVVVAPRPRWRRSLFLPVARSSIMRA